MRRHRIILPGPVLVGFSELFDKSYGNPKTPRPYPKVTPARIGQALLPFACPHCSAPVAVDAKRRAHYTDAERGHSWCPSCGGRYILNADGAPLERSLPKGATVAPALVERGGQVSVLAPHLEDGLNVLGVL